MVRSKQYETVWLLCMNDDRSYFSRIDRTRGNTLMAFIQKVRRHQLCPPFRLDTADASPTGDPTFGIEKIQFSSIPREDSSRLVPRHNDPQIRI